MRDNQISPTMKAQINGVRRCADVRCDNAAALGSVWCEACRDEAAALEEQAEAIGRLRAQRLLATWEYRLTITGEPREEWIPVPARVLGALIVTVCIVAVGAAIIGTIYLFAWGHGVR